MSIFAGALTAMVTPLRDGGIDETALRDLVDFQIEQGIDGLVPCGTTGESVNLSDDEYQRVVRIVVEQARGRVPVVAGAGTASTRHTIELARLAQKAGADGLLVVVPYYNRPSQAGLEAHYRAISAAVPLDIVLYNIPGRSGVDLGVETLERLSDVSSIVAIKEATNNVVRSAEIAARLGDRYTILSGDDALTLPIIAVGGSGVISVASNVAPADVARLVNLCRAGDGTEARALDRRLRPLYKALFLEPSPGPVKAALAACGRIAPEIRLPLVMPDEQTQSALRSVLSQLEVL